MEADARTPGPAVRYRSRTAGGLTSTPGVDSGRCAGAVPGAAQHVGRAERQRPGSLKGKGAAAESGRFKIATALADASRPASHGPDAAHPASPRALPHSRGRPVPAAGGASVSFGSECSSVALGIRSGRFWCHGRRERERVALWQEADEEEAVAEVPVTHCWLKPKGSSG